MVTLACCCATVIYASRGTEGTGRCAYALNSVAPFDRRDDGEATALAARAYAETDAQLRASPKQKS